MSNTFQLFRLSLAKRKQRDMFSSVDQAIIELQQRDYYQESSVEQEDFSQSNHFSDPTREEYLTQLFSIKQTFSHKGNDFHYIPSPDHCIDATIIGRIGRSIISNENLPPEDGLIETQHKTWKACPIIIDPTNHEDGQKISFNLDKSVGAPNALVRSLISRLNEKYHVSTYHIDVEPLFNEKTFWSFANNHKGTITSLTFEFVTPNMFGGSDNITEEMRDFRDVEKAQKVTVKLSSDDGLAGDTERVKKSVEYATQGGGTIKARSKGGQTYNSEDRIDSVILDEKHTVEGESLLQKIATNISRVLGRE